LLLGVKKVVKNSAEAKQIKASAVLFRKGINFTKKGAKGLFFLALTAFAKIIHHFSRKIKEVY